MIHIVEEVNSQHKTL